tara:strand:- start:18785 stop:19297 length:513 start_codon:yes stop_codon:yes gene_type:complete
MNENIFCLRNVENNDHNWLVSLHNDPDVLYNMTNPMPITIESHMKWWDTIDGKKQIRKVFCVNGERVGFAKFYNIDKVNKNCVLGGDIEKTHRGKGYAKHMWKLMLDFCYNDLDMFRVGLTTAEYNKIGKKVYSKLGFIEEGKLVKSLLRDNTYYDQICMYHLKDWFKNE